MERPEKERIKRERALAVERQQEEEAQQLAKNEILEKDELKKIERCVNGTKTGG